MEPEERKISVWLCQEEKLISGLSRRTTCSDVVRVLLEDDSQRQQLPAQPESGGGVLTGPPESYCIVEKWRGFERILPNKTKILRLWAAWGDEQENVRFVLVRSAASLPNTGPRSAEARVVPSKERPCHGLGAARPGLALPREKQRRVVRKAFRKLANLNKKRQQPLATEAPSAERMETLVHLVLSQDHTIRQQIQRLRELDREIDRYEATIHLDRMKRHGANYVQDTYLMGASSGKPEPGADGADGRLEEYARRCEEVLQLQEQRARQEERLEQLAGELQEELNERWMKRRREELAAAKGCGSNPAELDCHSTELSGGAGGELHWEQERVKTQLSTSLYVGLRLSTDLEATRTDLAYAQRARDAKEREQQRLLETLNALDLADTQTAAQTLRPDALASSSSSLPEAGRGSLENSSEAWEEQARGCKESDENDEDSDTGLSSMHSQDSDSVPACESLV
uniref:Ras association domain family member 10 n=1 Tax=Pelodiscus sinensis TaxID=13735 RepID=K7F165_PELSI|nr:ras association domain-containing protein 10 [Pelodiscus sinensis]|eukprot:XP_006113451.1 ras association domain-containing protein 10 [Pelodiscus sinensis]